MVCITFESLLHTLYKQQQKPDATIALVTKKQNQIHGSAQPWESNSSLLSHFTATLISEDSFVDQFWFLIIILQFSHSIFCHNPESAKTIIKTMFASGHPGSQRQRKGDPEGASLQLPSQQRTSSDKDQNRLPLKFNYKI